MLLETVFRIRIRFILAFRIRIRFMKRIRFQVAKKSAKIMANSHKNKPTSQEYHVFLLNIKLTLTNINIYFINIIYEVITITKKNNFLENYIFDNIKKVFI